MRAVMAAIAAHLMGELRKEAPVDTGRLAGSFQLDEDRSALGLPEFHIRSGVNYALAVHTGTGVYGPSRQPITPVRAQRLAFSVGGVPVFAKSVKGSPPNPYIDRAIDSTKSRASSLASIAMNQMV